MKVYTKGGDDGTTGLFGGARVAKCDPRVAAYGDVDETNAAIGLVLSGSSWPGGEEILRTVQSELFCIGAVLAAPSGDPGIERIGEGHVARLEGWIDRSDSRVAAMKQFIMPGGCPTAAALHVARTVCRRAERSVTALTQHVEIDPWVLIYLNRLSDLLFMLARLANLDAGVADVPWVAPRKPS